ncbi:ictacalcin-like [Myripristis murdjan]|uniref:Ictacalcin-like n=1 Tax=Myripristis murdjan TaxID=586833 RepID=A0A668A182_9TELE|nr:ictacalcin-like [Myripristis murdjan]
MTTDLTHAMTLLIKVFYKYSGKDGDKFTLSKGEVKDLLQSELPELKSCGNKADIDKWFNDLDANKDNTVDFQEFVTLAACLTLMTNEFFQQQK